MYVNKIKIKTNCPIEIISFKERTHSERDTNLMNLHSADGMQKKPNRNTNVEECKSIEREREMERIRIYKKKYKNQKK